MPLTHARNAARPMRLIRSAAVTAIHLLTLDLDHTLWDPDAALQRGELDSHAWLAQAVPAFGEQFPLDTFIHWRMQQREQHPAATKHHVSALRQLAFREALLQCGETAARAETLAKQAFDVFWHCRQHVRVFDDTPTVLQQLAAQYTLGALSNGNACLQAIGLAPYFAFHFAAEAFPAPKPAPDLFRAALQRAHASAAHSVHIGDHPVDDIQGAHAVGMKTVWVNLKGTVWPSSQPRPDAEVQRVRDIPVAVQRLSARGVAL